jgi:tetratricopeptide (TPR) repeat protein
LYGKKESTDYSVFTTSRFARQLSRMVPTALIAGGLAFSAGPSVAPLNTSALSSGSVLTQAAKALSTGDYKKAVSLYEQAVRLQPDNSSAYDGLGRAYERLAESSPLPGRLAGKARKSYEIALNLDPLNVEALQGLIEMHTLPVGVCYGNLDEAARLVERLDNIDPALGELDRFRLEEATRESHAPEMSVRCGYQSVTKAAEKIVGARKTSADLR